MQIHLACELFPELPQDQLEALAKSIKENGLLVPIITLDGQILDGRSRFKACEIAGVEPKFKDAADVPAFEMAKGDPFAFSVAMNLNRRHLDASQRGMIAAKIATMKQYDNQYTSKVDGSVEPTSQNKSIGEAAKLMNVSPATVKRARKVREHGIPELVAKVEAGEVSVKAASDVVKLPETEQHDAVAMGPVEVKRVAKRLRDDVRKEAVAEEECVSRPNCIALQFARMAIMDLEQIHADDIEKPEAWSTVRRWLDENE